MHELSIAEAIVDACCERSQGSKVVRVTVEVGSLAGVLPDALQMGFDVCSRDTELEAAELHIVETPGLGRCANCGELFELASHFTPCPHCGGMMTELLSGEELRLISMEIS
jgi:hydrogenase nickel incorporation protein HypA/HybF